MKWHKATELLPKRDYDFDTVGSASVNVLFCHDDLIFWGYFTYSDNEWHYWYVEEEDWNIYKYPVTHWAYVALPDENGIIPIDGDTA